MRVQQRLREAREREERARLEEMEWVGELVKRRRRENEASEALVGSTTRACPRCRAPIEKNMKWRVFVDLWAGEVVANRGDSSHMTCEFRPLSFRVGAVGFVSHGFQLIQSRPRLEMSPPVLLELSSTVERPSL